VFGTVPAQLGSTPANVVVVLVSTVAVYAVVILATRVVGLRSFSKMSAFDFAMTVAVGSIIAAVGTGNVALVDGIVTVAVLYGAQFCVAWLRQRSDVLGIVDNRPLLLMHEGTVYREHLRRARITDEDLRGKLREAGVLDTAQVQAVVLETTGNVSVLVGDHLDVTLLEGVVGVEHLTG
jgi:uncharacterized membrane protein YcaP (DUF421 family)